MIQKLFVLLIIHLIFFSKYDFSLYSIQKRRLFFYYEKTNLENNRINELFKSNNYSFSLSDCNNSFNAKDIYFRIFNLSYNINFRFNIIYIEYKILFFYKNQSLILPSDLSLYHDLHIYCHMKKEETNWSIDSLAYIELNKYFKCIEYINIKEKIKFGILIYELFNSTSCINFTQYFFSDDIFNYNKFNNKQNNKLFHPLLLEKEFYLINKNISSKLKNIYIQKPKCETKTKIDLPKNDWKFLNIYHHYFCFCRGDNCLYYNLLNHKNSTQICKYKFYLNLIEENKYLYNKTDYLLADFPGDFQSLDDAYPLFKKLIKLKKNAFYMTINKMIINNKNIDDILKNHIIKGNMIDGNFLEKYFSLILRLKAVISGAEYFSFHNIFYYIDYITFISLTHGINYFKTELYKTYYGNKRYNKIVISTSDQIISLALQNGWNDKDLIKLCFPKWDKLDFFKNKKYKKQNKSIFFFFTWRNWNKNIFDEMILKSNYFQNIIELLNNEYLINSFNHNNITLYFCLHHMLSIYKDKLNFKNRNIKFIEQNEIFQIIMKSNMLVTDFSSIIFEYIYLNKPYVMFIPDADDQNIEKIYNQEYYNLITKFKEGSISFMNEYLNINQVVNKIINYINNNFNVEKNLSEFYNKFNFTCGNNTMKFINYLDNLKNDNEFF